MPATSSPLHLKNTTTDRELKIPVNRRVVRVSNLKPTRARSRSRGAAHDSFKLLFQSGFTQADVTAYEFTEFKLEDFDYFGYFRRDIFLRSQAFAFDHFGRQGRHQVVAALRWADDILFTQATDRDDTILQRLPDLALRTLPGEVAWLGPLGVVGTSESRYTYFHAGQDPQVQFPGFGVGGLPPGRYRLHTWGESTPPASRQVTVRSRRAASVAIANPILPELRLVI